MFLDKHRVSINCAFQLVIHKYTLQNCEMLNLPGIYDHKRKASVKVSGKVSNTAENSTTPINSLKKSGDIPTASTKLSSRSREGVENCISAVKDAALKASLRHKKYHQAVKNGRDPRSFPRREGPLWSEVKELNQRVKKASTGAPLREVLTINKKLEEPIPISTTLAKSIKPVLHANSTIKYISNSAFCDKTKKLQKLKGNINFDLFGEDKTKLRTKDVMTTKHAKNERLVPSFDPSTDLVRSTSSFSIYCIKFTIHYQSLFALLY